MSTINLAKVELTEAGQSINLTKSNDIVINLNWNQGGAEPPPPAPVRVARPRGFWDSLLGRPVQYDYVQPKAPPRRRIDPIDLDLGALYELQDGTKGLVQALGECWGDYDYAPFLTLDGDDRTGESTDGETIRINGRHWSQIKRILIYTFIYEGAPNWKATDGVVTVTADGQPPVEVKLTNGNDNEALCGIAMLENVGGEIKITRLVRYFPSQSYLDRAYRWGMQWQAGRK